ncbi:MAG: hypothetical protein IV092_06790 [Burkholderiaceae bacterium]|nr:hypothetical protein [Burkholderiaceae bacterium]
MIRISKVGKTFQINGEPRTALDASGLQRLRQRVGMVFQHFNLPQAKTVAEDIRFPLKLAAALHSPEVKKFIEEKYKGAVVPAF